MTRIDIAEVTHFSQQLRASNQELKQYVNAIKQAVIAYINDTSISGDAIASSKEYYASAYFPLCASIKQALDLSERKMQKYITDFHSQVDSAPNSRLDVDGIHDLNQKITGFENRLESVTSQLTAINGTGHASELNYLATQIFEAHKKEDILNKFMDFEQSHGNFFDEVGELAYYIKRALDNIQQNLKFDGKTGMYQLEKLSAETFRQLTKMYASQQEIDDKIKEIEEIGLTPNVPKGNSAGFITIDGKMSTEATLDFVNQQMIYWQSETVFREVLGVGSFYRAVYGVDAVLGKHVSDGQRLLDGALVLAQYGAPVLGLTKFSKTFGIKEMKTTFNKNADPFYDLYGSGLVSHPKEWTAIINDLEKKGISISYRDGVMAYAPNPKGGVAGRVIIDKNASLSALKHEYQHALDDINGGFPGMQIQFQTKARLKMEFDAYMQEIHWADSIGRKDIANQLFENYLVERQHITNHLK
ncbi:T7SS effector LXG polymorphic toxin [Listeria booriae]|uniref:LXG domain-containing protein n=1 Tax=Listeria booriae TaxID=1552123 RepID=A0A7X0ZVP2_9LIST|nr:T7SS effector LXG polymorphic toxin [Listeria booriae]MBC2311079.1 hypothetical protein [Listeria booriae]